MKLLSVLFTCALLAATSGLAAHLKRTNALPMHLIQSSATRSQNPSIDQ